MALPAKMGMLLGIIVILSAIVSKSHSRQTDVRWLLQPELQLKVIERENVTFRWLYKRPPYTRNDGKLMFSHHIPGNSFGNVLLEGDVNPQSGLVSLTLNMNPDRVSLTCRGHEILIVIQDITMEEYGRYLLDLTFDSDAAMHDVIDVVTFKDPMWKETPRSEILARATKHVTLKWKRDTVEGQPAIQMVTLLYNSFLSENVIEVIKTYKMKDYDHWQTEFSPEGLHLSDRMLHEYNPQRDVFQISFWDLVVEDSGEYELRLTFEDDVTELESAVSLHVTESSTWRNDPDNDVYGVLFNDVNLTYLPSLNYTTYAQKYKLFKFRDKREEELISISVRGNDLVERRSRSVNYSKNILCAFNEEGQGLLLTFHDVQPEYNGSYMLKMFIEETLAVKHNFYFHVLTEDELWPTVMSNDQVLELRDTSLVTSDTGMYTFIMPAAVPRPHVIMYTGSDDDKEIRADVASADKFDMWIEGNVLAEGLNVIVDYKFCVLNFKLDSGKKQKLVSHAGVFTAFNEHTKEAAIIYITCFTLLICSLIIIIVTYCTYKELRKKNINTRCQCQCSRIEHQRNNYINENIYEIPRKQAHISIDDADGLTTSTPLKPRCRKPWFSRSPSGAESQNDPDWPSGDENEPMITSLSEQPNPLGSSALPYPDSILKRNTDSPSSSLKRVQWEEQPVIRYEQVEQGSPKLPRY